MQPIILSLQAFGPFAGAEQVDFRRLGERPLFLINGATGSGKTTLLDAICFALYGKTTGNEREGAQMRSDLAADDLLTEVSFTFCIHQRFYKIRRTPEQSRPKARGDGLVKQAPEAQLWRLNAQLEEEEVLVGNKVTDATRIIEELLGLNADQFRQVMVLPQGKFRQLLMADSKEREQIFSQLFQTQIYKRIEEALKNQSLDIRRQAEDMSKQKSAWLKQADVDTVEQLQAIYTETQNALDHAEQERQAQQAQLTQHEQALQTAIALQAKFTRLDECRKTQAQLANQADAIAHQRKRIDQWNAASILAPHYQEWRKLTQQQATLTVEFQRSEHALKEAQIAYSKAQEASRKAPELELSKTDLTNKINELSRFSKQAHELSLLIQQLAAQDIQWQQTARNTERHTSALHQVQLELQHLEQQREQLRAQLDEEGAAQLSVKAWQETLELHQRHQQVNQELQRTQTALTECEQRGKQLKTRFESAEQHYLTIERNWHLGQAALLAKQLKHEEPCPVCGSLEHPEPAALTNNQPSEMERAEALAAHQQANIALTEEKTNYVHIRNKGAELSKALAELAARLGEHANSSSETIKIALHEAQLRLAALKEVRNQLSEVSQKLITATKQKQQAEQLHTDSMTQLRTAELEKNKLQSLESALKEALPERYQTAGQLEEDLRNTQIALEKTTNEIGNLQQRLADAGRLEERTQTQATEMQRQLASVTEECHQKQCLWHEMLQAQQLDEAVFLALLESLSEKPSYQHAVTEYDRTVQQNEGALALLSDELSNQSPPDLSALEAQKEAQKARLADADAAWKTIQSHHVLLTRVQSSLAQLDAQSKQLDAEYARIGTLSLAANGQTESKLSLQRFVLSVLLDDVLLEASRRMNLMSRGRYRLVRKEDRAKGNRASGLELEVDDAFTGRVRPVATLSGGESFIAALSLALGLSDVVQAYAGGIRLDTLFIDEGFGSLDPESLELAVRTLMDLQSAGRMVGVISHVTELKEQIPLRIDIAASQGGSKIQWRI